MKSEQKILSKIILRVLVLAFAFGAVVYGIVQLRSPASISENHPAHILFAAPQEKEH